MLIVKVYSTGKLQSLSERAHTKNYYSECLKPELGFRTFGIQTFAVYVFQRLSTTVKNGQFSKNTYKFRKL